ncbi:uncharacterized protein LOC114533262 [Dendronephthya gigantea]|uniref:uncharacterized protein LOC114533262 n=2 Tax=Dendronephthya gigantea TaxID=151771 RepID=UPI001069442F|nr:uncharacterized protein LOC114533262 [Dendronephthya gigantea]
MSNYCHENATCKNKIGSFECDCDEGFIGDGRDCKATNCSLLSCGENEQCVRADDIFKCICKDDYEEPDCRLVKATCNARGDPHYSTFDGKLFDFMGKCEYVLAKDSVNNTFEIRQVNEECGNSEPSCTKSLTVMFPNVTIQLLRGSVTVHGTTISLSTMYMANGVKISQPRSGITLVESDYGVEVEWNNVHNVRVTVFGRYLNRTSGLCGTYNRYRGDDFLMSNGTTTDNEVEFGNSWKTDPSCEDATFVDHPCTTNPDRNATARANCSALRDSPFDKCSSYINPDAEGYISDCEYDVCACDDHPTVCLCQAIEAYVDDCASYGVNITWLSYPQYQQCTTPCASDPCFNGGTCTNIHSNFSCSCPVGFTGHRCEMEVDDCDDLSCGENEVCVRVGDTFDCVCHQDYTGDDCKQKVEATCVTYEILIIERSMENVFDFMGKCEYVLAKDRVNNTFEIRQENEPCGNGLVTCTKSITVIFPGLTIKLQRGMTNVNGGEISSSTNYGAVNVTIHGNGRTVVTSDYGVTVFWNNVYNVRVTIAGRYVNRTSGLCGTYNKMKYDDFWTPYGTIVGDPVEFGNSWKVDPTCENATTVDHPCDANAERRLIARENCSALLKPPFSNCSSYINATEEGYISDCEYDMCACEDDSVACYCQALQTYADDCSSDVKITWMNLEQFAICNTPCASAPCYNGGTCTDIDSSSFECRCPAGYIGARCENKDLCQIPYLFLSTSSGTVSYNTENSTSIPMKVDDRVGALLSYDAINRRLYLYVNGEGITSYYLDGSDEMTTNIGNVKLFTVNGRNNLMYYYHELHSRIYVYNITGDQLPAIEVDALKDISSVKDLEMDTTNGYLYIARAGDPPIVRYNPADNTIMEFNFDGSAQSISVDEYNNVIYWANYDGINHNVMKTSLNKQTIGLNISYPGAVELTSDVLNLYVLDTSSNRIDKYLKTSSEKQGNFTYHVTINDLIIAYDNDECCAGSFCHVNSSCANSLGSFNCSCNEGFAGNGTYCEDVNECLMSNYCHENATCKNKIGSFKCDCDEGFIGDGRDCKATNCSLLSCGENEQCVRADDIFKCICKDDYEEPDCRLVKATCNARGDPHYSTFDGKLFDFMGRCEYVLAKDSVNNTFEIRQVNEECGNGEPSCTKSLTVMFPNVTIQLLRGSVTANGMTISLSTMYMANGVKISQPRSGITLVESDYGVEVEWNNVHNVRVTVFGRYLNRTSGLCGTYNRYGGDDFFMSNGTITDSEIEFGNSWKTDPNCEDATFVDHPCKTNPDRNATARANCSALRDSPFDKCSSYINPDSEGYINDCEYDVCACDDHPTVCLCQAIEAYVDDCASYGVNITWLSYPQYQQCTTPCASDPCFNGGTCTNIHSNFSCSCPVGFTGHRCEMEVDDCDDLSCGENEVCVRVGDTFDCVCHQDYTGDDCKEKVEATCVTYGDPHYKTFDGKRFDFMGKCEYVLAKDRVNNTFEIRQENEPCGNGLVTCTKSITVIFPGLTIKLQRGMTNVNGGEISSSTNYGAVNVTIHGNGRTVVTSDYGVTVFWNNVYNVRITIGGRYVNRTSGLCGTYNEMKYDDFWTSYGTIVTDPVEFGNSWKVDPTCENATTVDHPCDANPERRLIARQNCSTLLKPPFSNCSSYINATEEGYIAGCEYDMCACEDDPVVCYCQALEAYADDCSSDIQIQWKKSPEFAICGTPCASAPCFNGGSCKNLDGGAFECSCPFGFLGQRCELEDLCQVPILYYASDSAVYSYNTLTNKVMSIMQSSDTRLVYDKHSRRVLVYNASEAIYMVSLDGSHVKTLAADEEFIERFTYDGRRNVIYYLHNQADTIHMLNLTNMQDDEVVALSGYSSIRDLDFDAVKDQLVIVTSTNTSLVLYDYDMGSVRVIGYDHGAGQSLFVYDGTIYWIIYDSFTNTFRLLCTSFAGVTRDLGITYNTEIHVVVNRQYFYVLVTDNDRIDVYSKTTSLKLREVQLVADVKELILAFDVDECCSNNTCHMNATCSNTPGSFVCTCNEGFEAVGDVCEDINECNRSYCHPNADCVNNMGSFTCSCWSGYKGDGLNCTETCEDEMLFYSTDSEIISHYPACNISASDSKLSYDKHNRRILYYVDSGNILYSADLNCSESKVVTHNVRVVNYAYDGVNGILYYVHQYTPFIHSLNVSSGDDKSIQELSSFTGVKEMEMDIKHGYLIIARSSKPPIAFFDTQSSTTKEIDYDGSAQALSVDQDNKAVYWDNFDEDKETHNLMRTYYTEQTQNLNISYNGEIELAQDYRYLYVLYKEGKTIDKYDKRTWMKLNSTQTNDGPQKVIVAFDYDECCAETFCPRENAICTNKPSSFECMCEKGYLHNGSYCHDIDECDMDNNCSVNATCTNTDGYYNCTCMEGTEGEPLNSVCTDINECESGASLCHANATCSNSYGSYSCECIEGYTGDGVNCTDIIDCTSDDYPCHENATCEDVPGSFECECMDGFTGNGTYCDDIIECEANPCHVNATCENTIGSYICRCVFWYKGDGVTCDAFLECTDDSVCDVNATCNNVTGRPVCTCNDGFIGNGSICQDRNECNATMYPCDEYAICNNTIGSFECVCKKGFTGNETFCEDLNECDLETDDCDGNATCTNTKGGYNCSCYDGFTGDGYECQDINECSEQNDCHRNATCVNTIGSYNCSCDDGFEGNGTYCKDVDECSSYNLNDCHMNATCNNTYGSFACYCKEGFNGNGTNCNDTDECHSDEDDCDDFATCHNSVGSYNCSCNEGYSGDGFDCQDIDECSLGYCHSNASCNNTAGSFSCACNEGFTGNGTYCEEIDECSEKTHNCHDNATCVNEPAGSFTCNCKPGFAGNGTYCENFNECKHTHNCHDNATCTDTIGSFNCTCKDGFNGDGVVCTDINECSDDTDNCHDNATCTNEPAGSFTCVCKEGFTGNGTYCDNIDECQRSPCDGNASCTDTEGSYECKCNDGFSGEGKTCTDINECSENTHNCHADNANCTNVPGSFTCGCQDGFSGDGRTACNNIDECSQSPPPCDTNATCTDTTGAYECKCNDGYSRDGKTCTDINECKAGTHNCHDNATCINQLASFTCTCKEGFTGNGTSCTNIDECSQSPPPCDSNATCTDTKGSYKCKCNDGYSGDGKTCADVNECLDPSRCSSDQTCENYPGEFRCYCKSPRQIINEITKQCRDVISYQFVIVILIPFNGDLLIPNSLLWFTRSFEIQTAINNVYLGSSLGSQYTGSQVTGFRQGSVKATYVATFQSGSNVTLEDAEKAIQTNLINNNTGTYLGNLRLNGSIPVEYEDYNECNPASTIHVPDCGEGAKCINLAGSYRCECDIGFEGTPPTCEAEKPPMYFVNDEDLELVKSLTIAMIAYLALCFFVTFVLLIAMCTTLSRAVEYLPEEDEIPMGRVTSIAAPKYEERQVMKEYYT